MIENQKYWCDKINLINLKKEMSTFFDLLINKTDAISCSILDQDENIIFSKNKELHSQNYKIELQKLFKIIKLISKNYKTNLDYHSKIQTIICSDMDKGGENGFFLLLKTSLKW